MKPKENSQPYYKQVPLHDGDHRTFDRRLPLRPTSIFLSSTLEATWSENMMTDLCLHRDDYQTWHGLENKYQYPSYGSCLTTVTFYNDTDRQLDMLVLEGSTKISRHQVPLKLYRLPLPTVKGLIHILWCDRMRITLEDPSIFEKAVPKLPTIDPGVHNECMIATISFPELVHGTLYKRLDDQPCFTKACRSPGNYHLTHRILEHQPHLEEITKRGDNYPSGLRIQPRWMHLLTEKIEDKDDIREPPSLFAQAYLKSSDKLDLEWSEEGRLPPYLSERYIHIRYKPADKGVNTYQYQHGWRNGRDIRDIFEIHPVPRFIDMRRYYDP